MITMGLFQFGLEMLHLQVDPSALASGGGVDLPNWIRLATWALEALALSTLFVLVHGRGWGGVSGLLTGWIAWVFRGPLLVITVAGHAGLPPAPWWSLAFRWWVLYSLCGLLLGVVASLTGLGQEAEAPAVATEAVRWMPPEPVRPFERSEPPPVPTVPTVEDEAVPVSERPDEPGATTG
jgi:hypothetical protein